MAAGVLSRRPVGRGSRRAAHGEGRRGRTDRASVGGSRRRGRREGPRGSGSPELGQALPGEGEHRLERTRGRGRRSQHGSGRSRPARRTRCPRARPARPADGPRDPGRGLRRHAVLADGAGDRPDPRRHLVAGRRPRSRRRPEDVARAGRRRLGHRGHAQPWGLPFGDRRRARGRGGHRCAVQAPADRCGGGHRAGGGRRDGRDRRSGSMSVLPRAHPPRCRTHPVADPCAGTADRRRDAPDLRGGRRDELRHARDRAAPSPVRPRAAEGTGDRGATGTGRREDGHARRCRANVDGRRPPDLRRRASRRGGRRHGWRARRDLRCHRADPAGSGVVRARRSPAHAPADRPLDGGLHAIRAGRRS